LNYLKEKYGVTPCIDPSVATKEAEIVIIAVKPQNVSTLAHSLVDLNAQAPTGLVLSIVAGLTLSEIAKQFRTNRIIRSMPNTPSMVLEGITVWTATNETPPELLEKARTLLATFGEQIEVADESYLDMATAISGTISYFCACCKTNKSHSFVHRFGSCVYIPYNGGDDRCCSAHGISSRNSQETRVVNYSWKRQLCSGYLRFYK